MRLLTILALSLIFSCKTRDSHPVVTALANSSSKNADSTGIADSKGIAQPHPIEYKIHTRETLGNYSVSVLQSLYDTASSQSFILTIDNRLKGGKDSLELTKVTDLQDRKVEIGDITKAIGFDQLTLSLSWEGESDNTYSEVVGYRQGKLEELFSIPGSGGLIDLKRKNRNMLEGHIFYSDDITQSQHDNYRITVALRDFSVNVYPPDTLLLNFDTKATDTIHGFRISSGRQIPYIVLPGAPLHLDTLFSKRQKVTLHLQDSIRLSVQHDDITSRIKSDDAG